MIVVDASLAVKLVIPEIDSAAADRWFIAAEDDIGAPDLIAIEVSQAVIRRVISQTMTLTEGGRAIAEWIAMLERSDVVLKPTNLTHLRAAAEAAMTLGHPVKDCIYLVLAMEFDCDLVTCDAKFAAKARRLYPAVKLLADYGN